MGIGVSETGQTPNPKPQTPRLYGSVLRDDFHPNSDVDVLVEFEPGHVPGFIGMAEIELEMSGILGRKVDLRTAAELSRYFRRQVLQEAETIYG